MTVSLSRWDLGDPHVAREERRFRTLVKYRSGRRGETLPRAGLDAGRGVWSFLVVPHPVARRQLLPALPSPHPLSRLNCLSHLQAKLFPALLNVCSFKFGQQCHLVPTSSRPQRVKKERRDCWWAVALIQSGEGLERNLRVPGEEGNLPQDSAEDSSLSLQPVSQPPTLHSQDWKAALACGLPDRSGACQSPGLHKPTS